MDERKERRNIKKAIVNPKEIYESEKESNHETYKTKKSNKRKLASKRADKKEEDQSGKAKKKLPAGLALMHGFNASNVGKQRLTVTILWVSVT